MNIESRQNIQLLSNDLINQIAAGEVIDRPYSVVKELVENSIDALSSKIFVNLEQGGKQLIEIIDNGHGIPKDEIKLAFKRHATSKIKYFDDLSQLHTMGFRGEALPSIASVSVVEVRTRFYKNSSAFFIKLENGNQVSFQECSRDIGTTIKVKNIFFNLPARKKFLKQNSTELRYIIAELNHHALAHPQIAFKLTHDKKEIFHYPPTENYEQRILQVFGNDTKNYLFPLEYKSNLGRINGFAGSPELIRKKSSIYTFINKRLIKDKVIIKAIMDVYRSMLEKNNYPFVVLYFDLDPALIDFNVHPSKREVKFDDSLNIFSMVSGSVSRALAKGFQKDQTISSLHSSGANPLRESPLSKGFQVPLELNIKKESSESNVTSPEINKVFHRIENNFHSNQTSSLNANLWQLHLTYIMCNSTEGLIILDQHAAAERILYEKILKNFEMTEPYSQQLLFPEVVELTSEEFNLFQSMKEIFQKVGFSVKEFSGNSIVIESIPAYIHNWESTATFKEILDDLYEDKEIRTKEKERIARYTACRAAIKSGDKLNQDQMQNLIDELFSCEFPYTCPHGRPTLIRINLTELEKRFGRK